MGYTGFMSNQTRQLVENIRHSLARARRRMVAVNLTRGGLLTLTIVLSLALVFVALEAWLWTPPGVRMVLATMFFVVLVAAAIWWLVRPLLQGLGWLPGLSDQDVARLLGRANESISDRLINLLHLVTGRHSDAPPDVMDRAVASLAEPIPETAVARIAPWRVVVLPARLLSLPVVVLAILAFAAPGWITDAGERLARPATSFSRPAPFQIAVEPGSTELIAGATFEARAVLSGAPDGVRPGLETMQTGENRAQMSDMSAAADPGSWYVSITDVKREFRYRIVAGSVSSPWYTVSLLNRPIVSQLNVDLVHPRYTRLPQRSLDNNVGDVSALTGTEVRVRVRTAGVRVEQASLVFESSRRVEAEIDGSLLSARFRITKNDTWHIELLSPDGIPNNSPIEYRISAARDLVPDVTILEPELTSDLPGDLRTFLLIGITDDYGFHDLTLHTRLAESRFGEVSDTFDVRSLPLGSTLQLDQEIPFDWDVAETTGLDLVPGDVVEYYVEVRDNDSVAGFKAAQSRVHRLRLPSAAERYETLDAKEDEAEEGLDELMERARKAREDFDALRKELLRDPEVDFQDERAVEKLQEQQREMEKAIDDVAEKMQEMADDMASEDLVSEETLQSFKELQEVVEEIRSPELMESLRNLEESLKQMNPNQMQEALEKFEFSETQYQQRLERTLDLFKNFRVQQDMEEVQKRADDLARTEEQLAEETGKLKEEESTDEQSARKDQLADEQEQAADEMENLQEKLQEIQERMEELRNQPKQEMQDLVEDTEDQKMPEKMRENAEETRSGNPQKAQQEQQDMSQQLQQLSGDLSQLQMNTAGQQQQINLAGVRSVLEDVLTLSRDQEALRQDVDGFATDSPKLRDAARQQAQLSDNLGVVADTLQRLSREIPQMSRVIQEETGNALRLMGESTDALTERTARRATTGQQGAMSHLNELALLLSDLLNQMNNASGAGQSNMSMEQMMEQLQNMGQQQQQLNEQIQQLLNDMQGNRLTQDMTERLRQLGAQQEQMRQQLRQLSRNRELRNKALGDLNRIAEQMQESIEELSENRANRRTIGRQNEILTRLLQASQSLQERGRENKRQGRSADDILRDSPAELSPSEQAERLRRDLIRALESGYADDYQQLIRRYFELLQESGSVPE